MDAIVNVVAEVLLLGSLSLLVWGAILTIGQLFRSQRGQRAADERQIGGEDRRTSSRPGAASARRRRFSRLAPPA